MNQVRPGTMRWVSNRETRGVSRGRPRGKRPVWVRRVGLVIAVVGMLPAVRLWTTPAVAGGCLAGCVADDLVAARAGLDREWVVQVPFDSSASGVAHVIADDGLVVVQAGDGGVHAIAAASRDPRAAAPVAGTVIWSRRLGRPAAPLQPAAVGAGLVAVPHDRDIVALEAASGRVAWRHALRSFPAAGPVVNGDWVSVPLDPRGLLRLPVDPTPDPSPARSAAGDRTRRLSAPRKPPRPLELSSGGAVAERPVPYGADGTVWTTTDGTLVLLRRVDADWRRDEFDLRAAVAGAPVVRGESIFVVTVGGDLARIDPRSRDLRVGWHTPLGTTVDAGPVVVGDTVVVSLGVDGLAAFSAATGEPRWRTPCGGRMLAALGDRVWCLDREGRLVAIDVASGAMTLRLCSGGFTVPVSNRSAGSLVLASSDGLVVSLMPRGMPEPVPAPAAVPSDRPEPAEARAVDGTVTDAP